MQVKASLDKGDRQAQIPRYMTPGSSGMDLFACLGEDQMVIMPGERALVPTGLRIAIPPGYEGEIRPRSGLAYKYGVTVLNAPGTIDSDYRGEVSVILINHGDAPFVIKSCDRIAQLVISPVVRAELEVVDSLDSTERGEGGFGHTGT